MIERRSYSADCPLRCDEEESEYEIQDSSAAKVNTLDKYLFVRTGSVVFTFENASILTSL